MDEKNSDSIKLQRILSCKWSSEILTLILRGIDRPGAIRRSINGLTAKVQADCLNKMTSAGILERFSHNEIPLRVEYKITSFGRRFISILDAVAELQNSLEGQIEKSETECIPSGASHLCNECKYLLSQHASQNYPL